MEYAVETQKLTKQFGSRKAVDGVSLQLPEGAFLSIFGPNGAGKTTLLRMLSTVARPTSGSASVCGFSVAEDPDKVRANIGLISHNSMLYPDLSALQNLQLYADLYGVENADARISQLLEAVELKHRRFDAVGTFSRGMVQRLAIARALVNDPKVVFLDEPYSGLDPHAVQVLDRMLGRAREGRTFVMVSHNLEKGFSLCTHALVMARGRIVRFAAKESLPFEEFRQLYMGTVGWGVS